MKPRRVDAESWGDSHGILLGHPAMIEVYDEA